MSYILTLKVLITTTADDIFLFFSEKIKLTFYVTGLLADDSHGMSSFIISKKYNNNNNNNKKKKIERCLL